MSLARFLVVLFSVTLIALSLAVAGVYYFSLKETEKQDQRLLRELAEATARQISGNLQHLSTVVEGLSRDPRLVDALVLGGETLRAEETRLSAVIPEGLAVRLLPQGSYTLDNQRQPAMGYADLDMVHQAETGVPPPSVHAFGSPDSHIAVARAIRREDRLAGILLASLSVKWLQKSVQAPTKGAIALLQDDLSLVAQGDNSLLSGTAQGFAPIDNTPWRIAYWLPPAQYQNALWVSALWAAAVGLVAVTMYLGWLKLRAALRKDETVLFTLMSDLAAGQARGSYSLALREFQPLLNRLMHLQRHPKKRPASVVVEEPKEERPEPVTQPEPVKVQAPEPAFSQAEPVEMSEPIAVPDSIFRAYDIRGLAGEELTPEVMFVLGRAIGSEAYAQGEQGVVVARDLRESSEALSRSLIEGIKSSGRDVIDLGPVPTPLVYFATHYLTVRSGVIVTASHNPQAYNGLKVVIAGEPCFGDKLKALARRIKEGDFTSGMGTLESQDLSADYIGAVVEDIQIGRPMKVIVECGKGVADPMVPMMLRTLGCEVEVLRSEKIADPGKPETLKALISKVKSDSEVELGLAFDGDGDRLIVVDSEGNLVLPDRVLMLLAADTLSREPGGDIVFDVKCSRHLASYIVQHGGRPVMSPSGYCNIRAKMEETGAVFAGEFSGHLVFKERWFGFDDAVYGAARLLEVLSAEPLSPAEVFAELPGSVATPELSLYLQEGQPEQIMGKLSESASTVFDDAKVSQLDGLRVDFVDGWGLVRASNTTPALIFRFEADDEDAMAHMQSRFKEWIESQAPDLELPFLSQREVAVHG